MRVVPDAVLESLTCRVCCKYLTVAPIGVHPEGGNVCGRCLYGKAPSPPSLFECRGPPSSEDLVPVLLLGYATYPEVLFPCVNRFEGCDELMPFSKVRSHEDTCVFKKYQCPSCRFAGVGTQLVQHFKAEHRRYLSPNGPAFALDVQADAGGACYLYRADAATLCLVKVRYAPDAGHLALDTVCLGARARKAGRIRLALRIPRRRAAGQAYEEFVLLSDRLLIARDDCFTLTLKVDSVRFAEAKRIVCAYKIVYLE